MSLNIEVKQDQSFSGILRVLTFQRKERNGLFFLRNTLVQLQVKKRLIETLTEGSEAMNVEKKEFEEREIS